MPMLSPQEKAMSGLRRLSLDDLPRYKAAFGRERRNAWQHYFPFLYLFSVTGKSEYILISEEGGSLCIYRRNITPGGPKLLLASLPMPMNLAVLEGCLARILEHNQGQAATINWVDEEDLGILNGLGGITATPYEPDYLFAPEIYQNLNGGKTSNLRKNLSRFRAQNDFELRAYTQDDLADCLALLDEWAVLQKDKHDKILYQRYTRDCLKFAGRFEGRDLFGKVVLIDGKTRSFGFGGEMRPGLGNLFLAYSDHRIKGLNYFLKTQLMLAMEDCVLVNDSRAGTPGLKYAKESLCPAAMHKVYRVKIESSNKGVGGLKAGHTQPPWPAAGIAGGVETLAKGISGNNELLMQSRISAGANCYSDSPFLHVKRNLAIDLIVDRAKAKGMEAVFHSPLIYELIGHGKSVVFNQNAPENSIVATAITPDKNLTKDVLAKKGLPVPQGRIYKNHDDAVRYFSWRKIPQVVKPNSGSHGNGVTTNITSAAEFEKAWLLAHQGNELVIVEDFIGGDDLRVIVAGGKALAAYVRVPAHVTGNGVDNIEKLVEEKNKIRSRNPRFKVSPIKRFDLLEANGMGLEFVPAAGEKIQLTSVSNISAGGESIEISDAIHASILEIAEQSVIVIPGLNLAGVDLIATDFTSPASSENRVVVLEINSNPSIVDTVFPMYGKPVDVPGMLVDYVLRDDKIGIKNAKPGARIATIICPEYIQSCGGMAFSPDYKTQMDIIKQAGYKHNLIITEISGFIFTLASENQEVTFFQGMPDRTKSISRTASNRKDWTKRLLKEAGVITPHGESFAEDERDKAWRFAEGLTRPVVVKPRAGSGGSGVSVDISTPEHFNLAWDLACKTNMGIILVEEYFHAKDYRLFVVGDQFAAAMQRIPAYLVGDGVHTVQQLIDEKNRLRLPNPHLGAKLIKITPMISFNLAQQGITDASVLNKDQYLQLHSVANIGSGGESVDVSEVMHPGFADIAIRARKAVFDPVHAGIDILAEDIARSPDEQGWMVIEVNINPDIALHHFPSSGTPRDAAGALVSHLFPEIFADKMPPKKLIRVLIKGKVQGVGFRNWIWRNAHLHAVSGWVKNNPDGALESVFHGAQNAVDHMVSICGKGPRHALVEEVALHPFEGEVPFGFVIDMNKTDAAGQHIAAGMETKLEKHTRSTDVNIYIKAARKLGLDFEIIWKGPVYCRISHGSNYLLLRNNALSLTSTVHRQMVHDKYIALQLFEKAGVPCPKARLFNIGKEKEILSYVATNRPVVIKPKSESLARGVCVNPQDDRAVLEAIRNIMELKRKQNFIQVENYIEGSDYRFLLYDGELMGALKWVPPYVVGDGVAAIKELIGAKSAYRVGNRLSAIVVEPGMIERQGFAVNSVLPRGVRCNLNSRSSHTVGGETTRVDPAQIHPDNLEACYRAAQATYLGFAGVDMISKDISISYRENGAAINEINSCPMIDGHYFADGGEDAREAEKVLRKYFGL